MMDDLEELAPHVMGYWATWEDGTRAVPWISSTDPGAGHVGRFLDGLPTDQRIAFPTVLSPKLAGMLHRRGFVHDDRLVWAAEYGEWVEGWVREPKQ
jgi:hypothetical protein